MENQRALNHLVVVVSWIAVLVAGALGVAPLLPLSPPTDTGPADFSVTAAQAHVERFAQEPRPIGSPASQRARAGIVAELEQLGLEAQVQTVEVPGYYPGSAALVEIGNVVARIPGTEPGWAVALAGHYDTVPGTVGAADDASAVAIMLEVARAIQSGPPLRRDVLLLFIDAEEPAPRFGSSALVAGPLWADDVGFVINLEAVGTVGPSMLVGMNGPGGWIVDQYTQAVPHPVIYSFLTTTADLIGGSNSDFATFRDQGVPGVEFAYVHGSSVYHTAADTPERLSRRSLYQQGANTLALTRQIGNLAPDLGPEGSSATFFNLGRFHVARYPIAWTLPLALVAGVPLLAAAWRQRAWLRILASVAITVVLTLIIAAVAAGLWTLSAGWRTMPGVAESYLYLAGFLALTTGIALAVARAVRRRLGEGPDATGVVAVWWALGLLTALAAPGMSYVFVWPALAGGAALLWRTMGGNRRWQPIFSVPVLGAAVVLLTPVVDTFYQLVQPRPGNPDSELLVFVALPVALLALGVELFRAFWLRPAEHLTPVPAVAGQAPSPQRRERQAAIQAAQVHPPSPDQPPSPHRAR